VLTPTGRHRTRSAWYRRFVRALLILIALPAIAHADDVFPVVSGTTFTFASEAYKDTWNTKLVDHGGVAQYVPHADLRLCGAIFLQIERRKFSRCSTAMGESPGTKRLIAFASQS
jgi:hypothetical protein